MEMVKQIEVKQIEREVKYQVYEPIQLIERVKYQNAIYIGYLLEKTIRVDKPNWLLSNSGSYLRLRTGFKNTMTLKGARKSDSEVCERTELEIEVNDIDLCKKILYDIGFTETLTMEKYRMLWRINDTIVTIDEMPFGIYTEIEGSITSIKIISELLNFDFKNRITITYWEIYNNIMQAQENKFYNPNIIFPENYVSKLLLND